MKYIALYKTFRRVIPIFLLLAIYQYPILAQIKSEKINGYGKASYDAEKPGKFMKTWLLAGPVSVSSDTLNPEDSLQVKAFKEDNLTSVNVIAGKPLSSVRI